MISQGDKVIRIATRNISSDLRILGKCHLGVLRKIIEKMMTSGRTMEFSRVIIE
jgi:hypothetical protein